ncbi:oxidoreductase [Steroidobacter agaridevorans]|uniref:Oxidoreductase n=1 Tax=Steroidobacter agaridevorans TaxID=2695856 RepID=A0A829YEP0_9GAMM|nr:aldo/keto reductase [Steroidobacter agaridevorans]GFE81729.1 oxidoreductase [Steroidobacter agaridevorans]
MSSVFTRREVLQSGMAAGVGFALSGAIAEAADSLPAITKPIPSTGEKLPVVGLGTNQYSVTAPEDIAARREVLENFPKLGAKVIDTARGYGESEVVIGKLLKELGNRDQIFLATKTPIRGEPASGDGELELAFQRLQTDRIDLLQIHNFNAIDALFPKLQEWKQAKKVRYIGITTSTDDQYPQVIEALNRLKLDFLQVDYSIDNRGSEEKILPLAKEKGVAVLTNVPLGGRRGSVLTKVAGKPLPAWAADYDVTSWAQLFLKYNISHPAVTAVIPGTTKITHLKDNQLAGRGRLPDAAGRKKIEELWASVSA